MPVLPPVLHHRDADTRVLESRQLHDLATKAARTAGQLLKRIPRLQTRQDNGGILAIPTQYQGLNAGPAPGAVVGIILGSIAGFLILIWLLWILSTGSGFIRSTALTEEDVVVRRRSRSRTTRRTRTEVSDRSPRRDRERVIRQERIVRDIPPPREPSRIRETIIMNGSRPPPERRVEGDDIVEVIEEHSSVGVPPPRRKTRRSSGYR